MGAVLTRVSVSRWLEWTGAPPGLSCVWAQLQGSSSSGFGVWGGQAGAVGGQQGSPEAAAWQGLGAPPLEFTRALVWPGVRTFSQ